MFEQMRRNTKIVLWITVIAFVGLIFLAWGADFQVGGQNQIAPGSIGSINGQPIPARAYDQMVQLAFENYKQQSGGREPDERTSVLLRNQAWNELVQDLLLRQEAERRGITVSNEELAEVVLNQPAADLRSLPQLQTNGQFDLAKYQAMLRNPNVDTRPLEEQYRRNLPLQKLQYQVIGAVSISDEELWETYRSQNEKIRAACLMLPGTKFTVDEASVTDADLQRHYESHRSVYRAAPQAVLQYVQVPRRYTEIDSLNLIEQGRQVLQELQEGEDFLVLVDAYSEASPQLRGGEQGAFLTADQFTDPVVAQAAFSLPVDGVSDVLSSRNGVHIIKVLARQDSPTGTQVKVADVFLPLEPSPETISMLREQVAELHGLASGSFEQAAQENGLPVNETAPFGEGGFVPGIGSAPDLAAFAFKADPGAMAVPIETADGWIVARLKERRPERTQDLSEIADRVRAEVLDSLRVMQAAQVADGLLRQAQSGTPLAVLAASEPRATLETPDPFPRLGYPRGIGSDPAVIGPLFARSETGVVPQVLRGRTAAFVCEVQEIVPADRAAFDQQKEALRRSAIQRRQSQVFNEWLAGLKKGAEIRDYRWGAYES